MSHWHELEAAAKHPSCHHSTGGPAVPPQPLLLIPFKAKPGGFCNLHASPCPRLQWIWDSQPQPVLNPAAPGGICSFHLTCTSLGGLTQCVAGAGQVGTGTKPSQTPFQSPASCSTLGSLLAHSPFQGPSLVPAPSSPPVQVTPAPVSVCSAQAIFSPQFPPKPSSLQWKPYQGAICPTKADPKASLHRRDHSGDTGSPGDGLTRAGHPRTLRGGGCWHSSQ